MNETRPMLKIPLSPLDKALEVFCWLGLALIWLAAFLAVLQLPEIVPIHFDPAGQADGYGSKLSVLFLPVIPTVLTIGLTLLNRYPHMFNYLEEITPENAARNYRFGTRLLRYVKLFQLIIFGAVLFLVINSAYQNFTAKEITRNVNLTIWATLLLPLVILLIIFLQYRKNKHSQNA